MARVRVKIPKEQPNQDSEQTAVAASEKLDETTSEATKKPADAVTTDSPPPTDEAKAQELDPPKAESTQPPNPSSHHPDSSKTIVVSKRTTLSVAVALLLLILLIMAISNREKEPLPTNEQNNSSNAQSDSQKYHDEVKAYLELPSDKPLEFAEVKDAAKLKLKNPAIFKNTQDGDVVLFYQNPDKSLQVVVYRPSTKKLITYLDGINQNSQPIDTGVNPSN